MVNFVYSTLSYDSPPIFWDWFTYSHQVHSYSTTSSTVIVRENYFDVGTVQETYTLYIQKAKLEKYGKRMMKILGPLLWNKLPEHLQDSDSSYTFKRNVKKYFIDQYKENL